MPEPAAAESGSTEPDGTEPAPTPLLHPAEGIPELSVTVRQIAAAAEEAGSASRQAATASAEQARGAEDLAAAIEEIASLADELKQRNSSTAP